MQGFNHVAGGIVFTGIFASFTDVNIFERPEMVGATVLFSILPDADHTRSLIGKAVFPLAKFINTKFGHRTITHSFVFLFGVVLIIRLLEMMFYKPPIFSIIAFYGILSHDVFDMCTRQGIQFFYPFSKRPAVLPANPQMRLQTNDLRSEAIIFVIFCSLIAFCQPLFANGFWTQYYKTFLTYKAVRQEANRSKNLLEITFAEKGKDTTKALFIKHEETYFVIYDRDFKKIEIEESTKFLDFKVSNFTLGFQQLQVYSVTQDSLLKLLKFPILKAQIQSNQELKYYEGAILKSSKNIDFEYKKGFSFSLDSLDFSSDSLEIELIKADKEKEMQAYYSKLNIENSKIEKLRSERNELFKQKNHCERLIKFGSAYEKGKAIEMLKSVNQEIEKFEIEESEIEAPSLKEFDLKIKAIEDKMQKSKVLLSANLIFMKLNKMAK